MSDDVLTNCTIFSLGGRKNKDKGGLKRFQEPGFTKKTK